MAIPPQSLPPRARAYLEAVVQLAAEVPGKPVSVVLFGSSATGGFSARVSDVDLLLVVGDDAGREERRGLVDDLARLEVQYGFRELPARPRGRLERIVERVMGNVPSFFVCTRSDLLSGDVGRILGLARAQALLVDRAVLPSILASAVTLSGEDLLARVPSLPIRRIDVLKAFQGLFGQVALSATLFAFLPEATRYAAAALKRSVHNCFFCYHGRAAPLEEEVEFFQGRLGRSLALPQLLALRGEYRRSFSFVVRCLPTLVLLHFRTLAENRFPLGIRPRTADDSEP
jgi:hypothetical protein